MCVQVSSEAGSHHVSIWELKLSAMDAVSSDVESFGRPAALSATS